MNKKDRDRIKQAALHAFRHTDLIELPVNIKYMVKSFGNIRLVKYSKHMQRQGLSLKEMILYAGTDDAYTDYEVRSGKYIIYYNDLNDFLMNTKRYRWSIAHELGHVLLKHHKKTDKTRLFRNRLSEEEYKVLEDEANMFAAYLLVPHAALYHFPIKKRSDIMKYCNISDSAAKVRIVDYNKWYKQRFAEQYDFNVDDIFIKPLIAQYSSDPNFSRARVLKKAKCNICGFMMYAKSELSDLHCPICGVLQLYITKEKVDMAIYSGVKCSEHFRPIECPKCSNEEIADDGNHCQICGTYIVNECLGDDCNYNTTPLPGNFRYCVYCGAKTTFFKNGFLKAWDAQEEDEPEQDDFPPFELDEDPPF